MVLRSPAFAAACKLESPIATRPTKLSEKASPVFDPTLVLSSSTPSGALISLKALPIGGSKGALIEPVVASIAQLVLKLNTFAENFPPLF